jgi:hypothetical protein
MTSAILLAIALRVIRIEPPAAADARWRVTYRFVQPVSKLDFARQSAFDRSAWREETDASRPRKTITLSVPVDFSHPQKDYQLFQRFSDGSVLLYTGHFTPAAVESPRFVLTPRRGEHLVIDGRVFQRRTSWVDKAGEGTFVYFGNLRPVETPHMIAVIDPAVPAWLSKRLREGVPQLFADYAALTGFKLEQRPTVFFSFEAARDPNSTTWAGGTLPGVIQLHVEAAADAKEDRALLERFFKFLAHEAAHMWNGQLFKGPEHDQSWMHEGGADAFAWRAMRRANLLDDRELNDRQTADLNQCLATIGAEAVDETESKGNFSAVYSCGSALAWFTDIAVRRSGQGDDLHTFWRALLRAASERDNHYDEALYFDVLRQKADASAVQFVDDFVHRPMSDRVERLTTAFRDQGVTLEPRPAEMPQEQRQNWSQNALVMVMRGDCRGRASVRRASGKMILAGRSDCATLTSEIAVDRVEGFGVGREGELVYDAVAARCAAGEPVTLEAGETKLSVKCKEKLPSRPPWLAVIR